MTRLPETQQVTRIGEPRCVRCRCRHRPDLPCWKGRYAAETTAAVLAQSAVCWICRGPATEADHIQPRSEGGDDALANLRPACRSCNAGRGVRPNPFHPEDPTPPAGVALSPRWRRREESTDDQSQPEHRKD